MNKICIKCNELKLFSSFYKRTSSIDGYQSICKVCRKEIDASSYKNSIKRKENIRINSSSKLKDHNRKLMRRYKKLCGCRLCSENEPVALDLHHRNNDKEFNPSSLLSYSTKTLINEIRKCVVLCSNCHRKVHAGILTLPL